MTLSKTSSTNLSLLLVIGASALAGPLSAQQRIPIRDQDWDYWTSAPDMFAIPDGNVGIGTDTPTSKLTVEGNTGVKIRPESSLSYYGYLVPDFSAGGGGFTLGSKAGPLFASRGCMSLQTQDETRMFIDYDGMIGIGTSDPQADVHLWKETEGCTALLIENPLEADPYGYQSDAALQLRVKYCDAGGPLGPRSGDSTASLTLKGGPVGTPTLVLNNPDGGIYLHTPEMLEIAANEGFDCQAGDSFHVTSPELRFWSEDVVTRIDSRFMVYDTYYWNGLAFDKVYLNILPEPDPDTGRRGVVLDGHSGKVYVDSDLEVGTPSDYQDLDVWGSIYQYGNVLHADYVFEDDYELESIEEHAAFMYDQHHLGAIPAATTDEATGLERIDVGQHRRGIVEELEKAHVYIDQLNEQLKAMSERMERLEEDLAAR